MATPRKPNPPTTETVDHFCAEFDEMFCRLAERQALRQYLTGLLLREHNKTLTVLVALAPEGGETCRRRPPSGGGLPERGSPPP